MVKNLMQNFGLLHLPSTLQSQMDFFNFRLLLYTVEVTATQSRKLKVDPTSTETTYCRCCEWGARRRGGWSKNWGGSSGSPRGSALLHGDKGWWLLAAGDFGTSGQGGKNFVFVWRAGLGGGQGCVVSRLWSLGVTVRAVQHVGLGRLAGWGSLNY